MEVSKAKVVGHPLVESGFCGEVGREGLGDCSFQSWQVVVDGIPDGFVAEAVIVVAQNVSHAANLAPVGAGTKVFVFGFEAVGCFGDDL